MADKIETVSEVRTEEASKINLGSWLLISLTESGDDSEKDTSCENLLMYNRWI